MNNSWNYPQIPWVPLYRNDMCLSGMNYVITTMSWWTRWCLKSPFRRRSKKASAYQAFVRGIDRWLVNSRTKDQHHGKCFQLMTSSCYIRFMFDGIISLEGCLPLKMPNNHPGICLVQQFEQIYYTVVIYTMNIQQLWIILQYSDTLIDAKIWDYRRFFPV